MDFNENNETLTGVVEEVVYYNDDNGYAVCYVKTKDEYTAVVGYLPLISAGESITVRGYKTYHPDYGEQFKAEYYEKNMPKEKAEILLYLSSGIIKGVRRSTAEKIVNHFGEKALDVIAGTPEKLSEISGISSKKAIEIGKSYSQQLGVREVVFFLQKYGVSPSYAVKVYKQYGSTSVDTIKKNPYLLAENVYGIGFKTADKIAMNMGIETNSKMRINSAVSYCLWDATLNGHTFLPKNILMQTTAKLIKVDEGEVNAEVNEMIFAGKLINEVHENYESIYLPTLYNAEQYVAKKLLMISETPHKGNNNIEKIIKNVEAEEKIVLTEKQKDAVINAVTNSAIVITGGPGTGKTTIITAIIAVMNHYGKTVMLAAPTGRAAKRMTEISGVESKTIHRLLECEFSEEQEGMKFIKNEDNPLDCDILIIDEMSMVDILLMNSVLKALKRTTRLVMVGDSDQLPSVGPGNVLRDIISSGNVPVVALTEIFRQAQESMIVVNAHNINNGIYPVLNKKGSDFFLVQRDSANEIVTSIIDLCINRLPKTYGIDPLNQIQVISPSRKSAVGVNALNEKLQAAINPPAHNKNEKHFKTYLFREGDKIMQIKNNYNIICKRIDDDSECVGVFNGDVGFIKEINFSEETMTVIYDDKLCEYPFSMLNEVSLAYATTVHKSQGSEFDVIVMPMYPCAPMLLSRNIFYTAVTRAKKLVVLVGRNQIITSMVDNVNEQQRFSGLSEKMTR